jgi:hypothetical protein
VAEPKRIARVGQLRYHHTELLIPGERDDIVLKRFSLWDAEE